MRSSSAAVPRSAVLAAVVPLVVAAALVELPSALAVTSAHPPLVVSLTFDDGTADHVQAASIVEAHGLRATYFIESGRVGQSGYLSWAQVHALADAGNEIGGHTVTHANLPTLDPDEAARQVCDDRSALLGQGFAVRTFAYPFGADDATTRSIVSSCGYSSARDVGGLATATSCSGCPHAEPLPLAADRQYAIRTADSVKADTTLTDMQAQVQAAEAVGGWLPIVLHHLCESTTCDPYSTTPGQLDAFLTWLVPRSADGTTVALMGDVVGGAVQPPVPGPAPPSGGDATNLLHNASMESDSDRNGTPDCWQHGGYGANTYRWTRTTDAHAGSYSDRVDISSFTDGDRRLISPQDLGACAPAISPGHAYRFSGWYKASGKVQLVAYYRTSTGAWNYWTQSSALTQTSSWSQAVWTTPAAPSGAVAISIGWSLRSAGYVIGDDTQLRDADTTAPAVVLTAPPDASTVSGTATISATASDASGIARVDLVVDGAVLCSDATAPYSCPWDTTAGPDRVAAVTARAIDTAGNTALATTAMVDVANAAPTTSPTPTPTTSPTPTPSTSSPTPTPSTSSPTPTPTATSTPGGLIRNGSFEDDANRDGVADCWQHGGYGTNTYAWSRTSAARTGSWAERVDVGSLSSGDRRLITPQNQPSCAPAAMPGRTYAFDGWYRTDAKVQVVAYYLNASGTWTYWTQSAVLPTSSAWAQVRWTTPSVPSGATALSIGWSIRSAGYLVADDASLS